MEQAASKAKLLIVFNTNYATIEKEENEAEKVYSETQLKDFIGVKRY